jgi:RHS repeat-associated protein
MVAENGQVVERYAYDPYGRAIVLNGEGDPDGAEYTPDADGLSDVANVILFAGYRFDAATGLYQARHRYHHPTLGRWITQDPAGYVDGMGLYEYCMSEPLNGADPMGLKRAKPAPERGDCEIQITDYGEAVGMSLEIEVNKGKDFELSYGDIDDDDGFIEEGFDLSKKAVFKAAKKLMTKAGVKKIQYK